MPATKGQAFRIKIIDDLFTRKAWVKTSTIKEIIEDRLRESVSSRTIQQDIIDMRDCDKLGYFAPIAYNKKLKAYGYSEKGYSIKNFSLLPEEIDALRFYAECLQVFSGYRIFNDFTSGIEKVINGVQTRRRLKSGTDTRLIIQTDSVATTQGEEYIGDMVYAVDNRLICSLAYHPYEQEQKYNRSVLPLLLKEYKNRWYLLCCRVDNKSIRTYALDRVKEFIISEDVADFRPEFDAESYFNHSFGITTPDAKVEHIVLEFSSQQAPYIQSLPIHKTQKVVEYTDKRIIISLDVILSYEVYEFILSKSPDIKVVAPISLAKEIAVKLKKASAMYKF